jgi:hypothetical protein
MRFPSFFTAALRWLVLAAFLSAGFAMAQQEPTMNQIYATAQAGKLDQAQVMIQQVLVAHPNSAKAHYVQSELFARQGNLTKARESLATAERLAPGLPFAKPEAVQALQSQLAAPVSKPQALSAAPYAAPPVKQSSSWLLPALLAGGVIVVAYFVFRRRTPQTFDQPVAYGNGLNGPQTFGAPGMQPAYGPAGYPQPGYGQPAGSGLGGRIMGGVATGLAVGAGVVAAEAIGRSLMGNHESTGQNSSGYVGNYEPVSSNADMGGQNFGVSDTSWEDSTLADSSGGGSDWDS